MRRYWCKNCNKFVDMRKDHTFLLRFYLIRRVCAICGKKVKRRGLRNKQTEI